MRAMNKFECTVRFLNPAFIGDAQQNGVWRTPPFKAQLRQFWRMVMASRGRGFEEIRVMEARLFGHAWLQDEDAHKSLVRLRLSNWKRGRLTGPWPKTGQIQNGKAQVDAGLYLGYGPVAQGAVLKGECAIKDGETATLRIGWRNHTEAKSPEGADALLPALALMHRYGTIGGRSRNGWGSYVLEGEECPALQAAPCLIDWKAGLQDSWAQGIGQDNQGALIWKTQACKNWQAVMRALGQLRSDVNRKFGDTENRSLLSYPVTKKNLQRWSGNDRLPNSLRFKVVEEGDQLQGLVFHIPCRPEDELWGKHPHDQAKLETLWSHVHRHLDSANDLQRVGA